MASSNALAAKTIRSRRRTGTCVLATLVAAFIAPTGGRSGSPLATDENPASDRSNATLATPISRCQSLVIPGEYTLTGDLECGQTDSLSLGSAIHVDCAGHTIHLTYPATVSVNGADSSLVQCVVRSTGGSAGGPFRYFSTEVRAASRGFRASQCSLESVRIQGAQGVVLANNTVVGTVVISASSSVTLQENSISVPSGQQGIYLARGGGEQHDSEQFDHWRRDWHLGVE